MTQTSTRQDLLLTCVQDLHSGCSAFADQFPPIATHADSETVREEFAQLVEHAEERRRRLEVMADAAEGPKNLWVAGMLDDAERDTQTIAPGVLLDLALIGAVRKMLVAEFVSVETAIVLARKLEQQSVLRYLQDNRTELGQLDSTLAGLLEQIADAKVSA